MQKGSTMRNLGLAKTACIIFLFCSATAMPSPAQTFTTLATFDGTDGATPYDSLVQGLNGNFYGTTYSYSGGGTSEHGTVFKITPAGKLTTLYDFCSQTNCTDGEYPNAGLVLASNGKFYGTTTAGGANNFGTVFEITSAGELTTLYSFCSQTNCTDGEEPYATLVRATNGNLYGTTEYGGANSSGTVFEITPAGKLTTLYSFCPQPNCTDGYYPVAALVQATNGNFYGTTPDGGASGSGTVFEITPAGKLTTLYSFCSKTDCADGEYPVAGLVQTTNGNLYGTTEVGGANYEGTVFEITPAGKLTTLYSFCSQTNCTDGSEPMSGLTQATNGNLYGTTSNGGAANGNGTIFEITPAGSLTTLYTFSCSETSCADGDTPFAGLVQATNGNFYGTTSSGGVNLGYGTVFSLSVGLGPFVETLPTSGKVGAAVKIFGTHLTGATSVDFNGTAGTFTVVSSTEITTTVPIGAATGTVEVTTPSGTLNSNVVFRVKP